MESIPGFQRSSSTTSNLFFQWLSKVHHVLEPYHSERVLRQFGRVQIITPSPLSPEKVRRELTANKYHVSYTWSDSFWDRWQSHTLSRAERSIEVRYQWDTVNGYMDWFRQISHLIIQNLSNRSLAPGHTRGEDVDAIVLAHVTYIFFDKHIKINCFNPIYYYFINILFIFTAVNS